MRMMVMAVGLLLASTVFIGAEEPLPSNKYGQEYKNKMVEGIIASRGYMLHVDRAYAERLVREVIEVVSQPGNRWMKPHILLGLAINESDLRWWIVTGSKYRQDCGICQNHTPLFEQTQAKRQALCKKLKESTKLSFQYAMLELNYIKKDWVDRYYPYPKRRIKEGQKNFTRRVNKRQVKWYGALLNIYNQGPRYLLSTCEQRLDKTKYTQERYNKLLRRCYYRNLYWVRSLCFSKGLFVGDAPEVVCRRAASVRWINRVYGDKGNLKWLQK